MNLDLRSVSNFKMIWNFSDPKSFVHSSSNQFTKCYDAFKVSTGNLVFCKNFLVFEDKNIFTSFLHRSILSERVQN